MAGLRIRVSLALFLTGMGSMILELVWIRQFTWIFGVTTRASAAVFGIYLVGLAGGSLWWGTAGCRPGGGASLFRRLAGGTALTAFLSPAILSFCRQAYLSLGGEMVLGVGITQTIRMLMAFVVIGPPTFCMGGLLPAAASLLVPAGDQPRRSLGWLSFLNLLGGAGGVFLVTFWGVEALGFRGTLVVGCALPLLAAFLLASGTDGSPQVDHGPEPVSPGAFDHPDGGSVPWPSRMAEENGDFPPRPGALPDDPSPMRSSFQVALLAFLAGGTLFSAELVWYRLLNPLLGGSWYSVGTTLAMVLAGLAVGGGVYALPWRREPPTFSQLAWVFLGLAAILAIGWAWGDGFVLLASWAQARWPVFPARVLGWTLVAGALTLLPAAFWGYLTPLVIGLAGQGRTRIGAETGVVMAGHALGGLAGSLLTGFWLLPAFSARGCWAGLVILLVVVGAGVGTIGGLGDAAGGRRRAGWVFLAAVTLLLLSTRGPTAAWRHAAVGLGRVPLAGLAPNDQRRQLHALRRGIAWEAEGGESSLAIQGSDGLAFILNGKADGNVAGDAGTQVMGGLLGAILHGHPRRAFVVGLGTGCTAGWLGHVDGLQCVDVVELEPAVVEMARRCSMANREVLANDRVHLRFGDAREILETATATYDLVFSEPSHPYRSGMAGLFSREFFQIVADRLATDGVFLHFAPGYEVDAGTFGTLYATLGSVFPLVDTWQTQGGDFFLVARKNPLAWTAADLRARLAQEPFASALWSAWKVTDLEGFLARFVAGPAFAAAMARPAGRPLPPNTDDWPIVELGYAKQAGRPETVVFSIREQAWRLGLARPEFLRDPPDQDHVLAHYPGIFTLAGLSPDPGFLPPALRTRSRMHGQFLVGNGPGVLALSGELASGPWPLLDRMMLFEASFLAGKPGETASLMQDPVLAGRPETLYLQAGRLAAAGAVAPAVTALESFFQRVRETPWVLRPFLGRALQLAVGLGRASPDDLARLAASLEKPFGGAVLDEARRRVLLELVAASDPDRAATVLSTFEPDVPWEEAFLKARAAVYQKAGSALAPQAQADLAAWTSGS